MYVMNAPVPVAAEAVARQKVHPAVTAGGLAKNMHDPNGLLDTRSASPRAPALIAAVCLEGILSETSLVSSRTSKKPNAKNIEKSCSNRQNEDVPPVF